MYHPGSFLTATTDIRLVILSIVVSIDPKLVILSGIVAIGLSAIAFWLKFHHLSFRLPEVTRIIITSLLIGVAISGMHYIAMAAMGYQLLFITPPNSIVIDASLLSIVIGIAALLILMLALLASFFSRRLSAEIARSEVLRLAEERLEELIKNRTEELEQEKLKSEGANRAKTAFLATMSHELRTPLSNIIGIASVLLEEVFGPLNEKQHKLIATLSKSSYELLDLINDLLDLAKIEAGREELYPETISIEQVCQESLSSVQEQANLSGLELSLEISPDVTNCTADKRRLKQILVNLLSNAIKFTENGCVKLKVDRESNSFRFAVLDTGIGIAPEDINKLFQPFQQLDSGFNRKYSGTGLGLALSKNLAQLHGGDITVESELKNGSCFTLVLPEVTSSISVE